MKFWYPPRPEKAIAPSLIKFYEGRGWIAQIKKNGTCSTANVDDHGNVTFFTRHGEAHKAWIPTEEAHGLVWPLSRLGTSFSSYCTQKARASATQSISSTC